MYERFKHKATAVLAFVVLVGITPACTKTVANQVVTGADVACEIVVKVEGLPDLCASAAEFARAVIALTSLPAVKAGGTATASEIRAEILRQRATAPAVTK